MARTPDGRRGRRDLDPEEVELWRHVTRDAAPLAGAAARPKPPARASMPADPPTPSPAMAPQRRQPAPVPMPPADAGPGPPAGRRASIAGLDRRNADRLRQGRLPIDGRLDLHGLTQPAAHQALVRFVEASTTAGRRCLLVITGKGGRRQEAGEGPVAERAAGVLREAVPRWLGQPEIRRHLIAVHPAAPQHGGDGAFYVLLKRRRGEAT